MNLSDVASTVLHNQMVTGVGTLAVFGAVAMHIGAILGALKSVILRYTTVTLAVDSSDTVYRWIEAWLSNHPKANRTRTMRLRSYEQWKEGDAETTFTLSPGEGWHLLFWNRRPIYIIKRTSEKSGSAKIIHSFDLVMLGFSQTRMRALVREAQSLVATDDETPIKVWNRHWQTTASKRIRGLDSVILRAGQMERIVADLQWFEQARDWYAVRGIPYRRGYLLCGPPGTGKTSIVMALAAYLKRPVCLLSLSAVEGDNDLVEAFIEAPHNAVILLEDIDCAKSKTSRKQQASTGEPEERTDDNGRGEGVTLAGLLNAIDGAATPDGRIVVMTTNFPERLDAALIRPGRADVEEKLDLLDASDQLRMAARFYSREGFVALDFPVSPAEMQGAFMRFPNDPEAARVALLERLSVSEAIDVPR